jgi:hypothetical protein
MNMPTNNITDTTTQVAQAGKPRFDPNSPEIKAYLNAVAHQFVREGTMVAFPTCLPGMTTPIPLDESRITALDINSDGHVYGGTSGARAHLFGSAFHGLTGLVLDVGPVDGATSTVAICCTEVRERRRGDDDESAAARAAERAWPGAVAFVNGPRGGRAYAVPHLDLTQDWIQEWGLDQTYAKDLGECVAGEPVVHAVSLPGGRSAVGVTTNHLFTVDFETGKIALVGEAPGRGRIVLGNGVVYGLDAGAQGDAKLWAFDVASAKLNRGAVSLPAGDWENGAALRWARNRDTAALYLADAAGSLFAFDEKPGTFRAIGKAHLAPVAAMAVTPDGRIFGSCGEEMANLFCCDVATGAATNLGVAASVIEQRRYSYQFGDAVTGRDGEIVLGENDNGGHMWIYFPKIRKSAV